MDLTISRILSGLIRRIKPLQAAKNKYLGTLVRVKTDKKVAAITFDDGPDPFWTPKILDILDEFNAKATFFVIGKRVENNPQIVKNAYNAGHAIANHTWDHPCLTLLSKSERMEQIERCQEVIFEFDSRYFRPPFGCQNLRSRFDLISRGYSAVGWNMHATDWEHRLAAEIAHDLNSRLRPGSIILLHDAQDGKSREEMINGLISFLKSNSDYQFVTIPELLEYGEKEEIIWIQKPGANNLKAHHERLDTINI